MTFLFLTPDGAFERHLSDLDEPVAQVRHLVSAELERHRLSRIGSPDCHICRSIRAEPVI